ncbi:MAG: hypothetical protein HKN26_02100 [Acidimicrobiales bacterium]|nr:hypothetical protein [Acidimicrobiales bacterium]
MKEHTPMGFLRDLRVSSTQAQLIQLATSVISLILIIRRFRSAAHRVSEFRVAQSTGGSTAERL